jgi:actin-related protein
MTEESQAPVAQPNDKELNFRALERKFDTRLQEIEAEKRKLELRIEELSSQKQADDDDDDEPYVDKKKLNKVLQSHGNATKSEIQRAMEQVKYSAKEELKQEMWLENNPDFYDTLKHAERFAQKAPKLAETILKMPEGFERQKLVYQNIKALGIDQPEQKIPSIQEKIDANRRSAYYQPTGIASPGYSHAGDFSPSGQKAAYDKLQELKKTLRI